MIMYNVPVSICKITGGIIMTSSESGKNILTVDGMRAYLSKAYTAYIKAGIPLKRFPSVMLWGAPGVGKSQGVREIAKDIETATGKKVHVTDVRLLLFNPVDLRGIPTASEDRTSAVWLRPEIFKMDESEDVINILFLDEISAAPPSVQAAAYQITLDRVIGEHRLPENCIVIAAGNRLTDRSVAYKMPKALANRLCHIEIRSDPESWRRWAISNGIHSIVTGFIDYNPTSLCCTEGNDGDNAFPTPRSWEMVSNILTHISDDINEVFPLISGCIGSTAAYSFKAWAEIFAKTPNVKDIFEGKPVKCPARPEIMFALISNMVLYATAHPVQKKLDNSIAFAEEHLTREFRSKLFGDYLKSGTLVPLLKKNYTFDDWMVRNRLEWEDYEADEY